MTDPRTQAFAEIRRALAERYPDEQLSSPDSLTQFAEGLHAAAIQFDVPVEHLFLWIAERDGRSLAAWRLECECYAEAREGRPRTA